MDAEELLNRGVEHIFPSKEWLADILNSGKKLTVYLGVDPTAPTLHIGHTIPLLKLREFQKLGHRAILLLGDFTARIGDPDKMSARRQLSEADVKKNLRLYKSQAGRYLDFHGDNPAEIKFNSKWLSRLSFEKILDLASRVTVSQMIERDLFKRRIAEGRPIYLHEFMYPLMQGYDSVAMDVDGEVGGNDQMFNMLMGREFAKEYMKKEKFVITTKLLTDADGAKMGKTEGNMVALCDTPKDMFGKIMSWPDEFIILGLTLCTEMSQTDIEKAEKDLRLGTNPMEKKMMLAHEITALSYGKKKAGIAQEEFVRTFRGRSVPWHPEEITVEHGDRLADAVCASGIVSSKSEYRRLLTEGAVSLWISDHETMKINDFNFIIDRQIVVQIGKKRFVKVVPVIK